MKTFKSHIDYQNFTREVKGNKRYIYSDQTNEFLEVILFSSKKRQDLITTEKILWRAQRGYKKKWVKIPEANEMVEQEVPFPPERMKPQKDQASEGRANPRGIAYIYLADDRDTALAEVHPYLNSQISVAQFEPVRDLKIVDCSKDSKGLSFKKLFMSGHISNQEIEQQVWHDINHGFSRPVNPHDPIAEYVPTQIIAELFRHEGYDGVRYKSSYEKGLNVVLFDLDSVQIQNCNLFELKKICFEFTVCGPNYIAKQSKQES